MAYIYILTVVLSLGVCGVSLPISERVSTEDKHQIYSETNGKSLESASGHEDYPRQTDAREKSIETFNYFPSEAVKAANTRDIIDIQKDDNSGSISYIIGPEKDSPSNSHVLNTSDKHASFPNANITQMGDKTSVQLSFFPTLQGSTFNRSDSIDPTISKNIRKIALSMVQNKYWHPDSDQEVVPVKAHVELDQIPLEYTEDGDTVLITVANAVKVDNIDTPIGDSDSSTVINEYLVNEKIPSQEEKEQKSNLELVHSVVENITETNDNIHSTIASKKVDKSTLSLSDDLMIDSSTLPVSDFTMNSILNSTPHTNPTNTPRLENSSTYDKIRNLFSVIANQKIQTPFLEDLIKNFKGLDQNAMKLIYSLLIQPLASKKQYSEQSYNLEHKEKENGSTVLNPSFADQSGFLPNNLWKPLSFISTKPPNLVERRHTGEVITAPSSDSFQVVLRSSFSQSNSDRTPLDRSSFAQNRMGKGEVFSQQNNLRLGLKMPPPEALAALPAGSVLVPPSQVLGHNLNLANLPTPPKRPPIHAGQNANFFPKPSFLNPLQRSTPHPKRPRTGFSALPSFLSYLFGGKSDEEDSSKEKQHYSFPSRSGFAEHDPMRPLHPPPPVFKQLDPELSFKQQPHHHTYASERHQHDSSNKQYSQYNNYYHRHKPITYSQIATKKSPNYEESDSISHPFIPFTRKEGQTHHANSYSAANIGGFINANSNTTKQLNMNAYTNYDGFANGKPSYLYQDSKYNGFKEGEKMFDFVFDEYSDMQTDSSKTDYLYKTNKMPYGITNINDSLESEPILVEDKGQQNPTHDQPNFYTNERVNSQLLKRKYIIPMEVSTFANLHDGHIRPLHDEADTYANPNPAAETEASVELYGQDERNSQINMDLPILEWDADQTRSEAPVEYFYYDSQPISEEKNAKNNDYNDLLSSDDVVTHPISREYDNYYEDMEESTWHEVNNTSVNKNWSNVDAQKSIEDELSMGKQETTLHVHTMRPSMEFLENGEFILSPSIDPVNVPEGTVIPKEDFEEALYKLRYKNKYRRPYTRKQLSTPQMKDKPISKKPTESNFPSLADEYDASIAHLWNNAKLIPLSEESEFSSTEDKILLMTPEEKSPPSADFNEPDNAKTKDEGKSFIAYILIGACISLAVFSVACVLIIVRFKKSCASRKIGGRTYISKQNSLKALSANVEDQNQLANESKTGHKLGSWFSGRNEQHLGTGKLRSNMTLPDIHDLSAATKSSSVRDLLSLGEDSLSQNSSPSQSQRSNASSSASTTNSSDVKTERNLDDMTVHHASSWLHRDLKASSTRESRGGRKVSRDNLDAKSKPHKKSHLSLRELNDARDFYHVDNKRAVPPSSIDSFRSSDYDKATAKTSQYPVDSERDDTNYELSLENCEKQERRFSRKDPSSFNSTDLGEELSRDLKVFQYRNSIPQQEAASALSTDPPPGDYAQSGTSFTNDKVQSEILIEFDNMLNQHRKSNSPREGNISKLLSGSRPDLRTDEPPPRPPKPSRLSPDTKKALRGGRARAKTPPPTNEFHASNEDDRLI